MEKIKLLIVEDHPFTKQTLVYEFKKIPQIELLAALNDGKEAVDFVQKMTPDIILMDIEMPAMNGIDATKEIKKNKKQIPIIMLTSHSEKEKVFGAFSSGANGYCIKDIDMQELIGVIGIVMTGGVWFDKKIAGYIFEVLKTLEVEDAVAVVNEAQEARKKIKSLHITEREMEILKLISDGLTNAQIAEQLIITLSTVKNHVASIIHKLSVKDRTQAAIFALNNKLLD